MANIKIYIPTFVSDAEFNPARVNPRVFFYNGTIDCEPFLIEANEGGTITQTSIPAFPYFDHYSVEPGGTLPGPNSNSLLFLNETAAYGTTPTGSLYDEYWEKYVSLLYDPKTRLLDASAIISLGDYNEMELNDIVQFRGNYYHLRAINEYDVKDGTCKIQLLGPILNDSLNVQKPINCEFDFTAVNYTPTPTTTTSTTTTSSPTTTTTTTTTSNYCSNPRGITVRCNRTSDCVGGATVNSCVNGETFGIPYRVYNDTYEVPGCVNGDDIWVAQNGFVIIGGSDNCAGVLNPILLGVSQEGSAAACDDFAFADTYWGNDTTFVLSTEIYTTEPGTTFAPAGFYSDGTNWKYWNGSSFTGSGVC